MLLKNLQISPVLESPFNKFEAMRISSKLVEDDFQIFISSLGQKKKLFLFPEIRVARKNLQPGSRKFIFLIDFSEIFTFLL